MIVSEKSEKVMKSDEKLQKVIKSFENSLGLPTVTVYVRVTGAVIPGSVTSSPSLAGPCTTRSELSGMTRAQARTKWPPGLFLPEIPLTLLKES